MALTSAIVVVVESTSEQSLSSLKRRKILTCGEVAAKERGYENSFRDGVCPGTKIFKNEGTQTRGKVFTGRCVSLEFAFFKGSKSTQAICHFCIVIRRIVLNTTLERFIQCPILSLMMHYLFGCFANEICCTSTF